MGGRKYNLIMISRMHFQKRKSFQIPGKVLNQLTEAGSKRHIDTYEQVSWKQEPEGKNTLESSVFILAFKIITPNER